MPEKKLGPAFTKEITDRTVVGIFAVHGNIDDGLDRSWPGSFANVAVNGRNRARFLWQHNSMDPPTAVIKSVREVSRVDLPSSVLGFAPEAMGGVEVTREYLDTPRGNEILAGIKAGAIEEMSYAYDVTRFDFETVDERQIRNIREVKLYDISDVTWGMNPATVAVKSNLVSGLPFVDHSELVVSAVREYADRVKSRIAARMAEDRKEGRVLSGENRKKIEDVVSMLQELLEMTAPRENGKALYAQFLKLEAHLNGALNL
jgi:HK97 family phage prohead protease